METLPSSFTKLLQICDPSQPRTSLRLQRHLLRRRRCPGRTSARSACLHGIQTRPVPPDPSPRVLSKKRASGLIAPHRSQDLAVLSVSATACSLIVLTAPVGSDLTADATI